MCHRPTRSALDAARKREELRRASERPERTHVWENTTPRENGELDLRDVKRSREKLEAVLGR
jgi:hypothetical protein